jgi:MerR family transcriptional regulator, heat shock protein HspR
MALPLDDESTPLYTVGQVAQLLAVKQAFLRRCDELRVVSPQRSAGGQRRYSRIEIRVIQQVVSMADEGMTLAAIRRIFELERALGELERRLAEVTRQRDELAARLSELAGTQQARTQQARTQQARTQRAGTQQDRTLADERRQT